MRQICLLFLVLTGCSASLEGERTIQDDLGRTVEVPHSIERVVPLAPNITELLFASGAGSKVVGVSAYDDFPPAVDSLPRYSVIPMDFEAIVALDVDLVFASEQVNNPKDANTFAAVGIPVYFVAVNTLEDLTRAMRDLGELLGTSGAAHKRATQLEDSLAQLAVLTANLPEKPDVLFLIDTTTLYAFGQGSYIHEIIDIAGGHSITKTHSIRFPILTDEFVLASDPDVIVGSFGPGFEKSRLLAHHPAWDILSSIVSDRVFGLDPAILRPGPRLVAGSWELARVLHPEAVTNP
ncbi:MAG: ABC transporter substrate-binding protein [Rhodothermaceae bacterium]|nr:ABC transporter substrate-binding protein [Rhodothermaceae bacterium]MXZ57389.1 ABC transporter substrate-binding protein [Rhodothermaceae bacterium]MYB90572.1 ABC transporter substrate-binding protein [Rhodothermaceae bacterium]MYD68320.1 ABC transporter substrate-binding protein [Rhodothermaceae bacterium]MYG44309.1 ABC transporter substrate-binding protein [Rhodothermaceae bacterium]